MIDVVEITIDEFIDDIYDKYIILFPKEEQRDWSKISNSYEMGLEMFYKIILDKKTIGFFLLEKIDNYPYYLDYFAIYQKYQNKGYGTQAIKKVINNYAYKDGLIAEIENVIDSKTERRLRFYERLGFIKLDSKFLLYDVLFNPIIYINNNDFNTEEINKIFFEYYRLNVGEKALKEKCRIIK